MTLLPTATDMQNQRRMEAMFPNMPGYQAPPRSGRPPSGIFGAIPTMPNAPAQPKPSFFGQGGMGRHIAGSIADSILQMGGGRPIYQPAMQQRQAMNFATQRDAMERKARMEDWMAQQDYARANPQPRDPYRWRANNGDLMELGGDGSPRVAYQDPTDKINWIQVRDPATGAISIVPMGPNGMMGGASGGPPDTLPADFDFGDGPPQAMSAPQSAPPVRTTTSEGLGAMISVHGVDQVEQWMRSGALTVRN